MSSVHSHEDLQNETTHRLRERLLKEIAQCNLAALKDLVEEVAVLMKAHRLNLDSVSLLDDLGDAGWNALHCASFKDLEQIVSWLLSYNIDVNKISQEGWTALQLAIRKNNTKVVRLLIECKRLNLNDVTAKGTALHVALKEDKLAIAEMLINSGCDLW